MPRPFFVFLQDIGHNDLEKALTAARLRPQMEHRAADLWCIVQALFKIHADNAEILRYRREAIRASLAISNPVVAINTLLAAMRGQGDETNAHACCALAARHSRRSDKPVPPGTRERVNTLLKTLRVNVDTQATLLRNACHTGLAPEQATKLAQASLVKRKTLEQFLMNQQIQQAAADAYLVTQARELARITTLPIEQRLGALDLMIKVFSIKYLPSPCLHPTLDAREETIMQVGGASKDRMYHLKRQLRLAVEYRVPKEHSRRVLRQLLEDIHTCLIPSRAHREVKQLVSSLQHHHAHELANELLILHQRTRASRKGVSDAPTPNA